MATEAERLAKVYGTTTQSVLADLPTFKRQEEIDRADAALSRSPVLSDVEAVDLRLERLGQTLQPDFAWDVRPTYAFRGLPFLFVPVAFLTGGWSARLAPEPRRKYCTVFMPTTPNPTTGFLMIVPTYQVRPLEISVNEALKLILSGGIVR